MSLNKKVSVIGLGYIGLPTAILAAKAGYKVSGTDIDESLRARISKGNIQTKEPGLKNLLKNVIKDGNFSTSSSIENSDIYVICVPTPFKKSKTKFPLPDMSYVNSVAKQIGKVIKKNDLVILESTSPVGSTEVIKGIISKESNNKKINICYCPERVLPGNIIYELENNDRLIGGIDDKSSILCKSFFKKITVGNIHITDSKTAELSKIIENSYRDVNIAFANEISMYCDLKKIDPYKVIKLANKHPRVNIMQPGIGVGGHCIAVDPWFLVSDNKKFTNLIQSARKINNEKTIWAYKKVIKKIKLMKNPKLAILGLAYKPDVDDLRESPSMNLARMLEKKFEIMCVEPNVDYLENKNLVELSYALQNANLILLTVPHKEFMHKKIINTIKSKDFLDFTGIL